MKILSYLMLGCLSLILSGCNIRTEQQIISKEQATNPWNGFSTIIFEMAEHKKFKPQQDFVLNILPDNTVSIATLLVRMAHSKALSAFFEYETYLITIPSQKKATTLVPDMSAIPAEYTVAAIILNKSGDVDGYVPTCSETVNSFQEAESAFLKCLKKLQKNARALCKLEKPVTEQHKCTSSGAYKFVPKWLFAEGF
ncbi:hypothetical protein [uncultured Sneathiella sp.]|uniref:hypothetical protein n=1 Tax=uncultured Sneathiella sp. TaxID=879315 RepID=UPI0030EBFB01